jgi:hypothetical protein
MSQGKILFGVLSLILYSKSHFLRLRTSLPAEFRYDTARGLAGDCLDTHDPEKMKSAHSGISAKRSLLFCRKNNGNTPVSGQPF